MAQWSKQGALQHRNEVLGDFVLKYRLSRERFWSPQDKDWSLFLDCRYHWFRPCNTPPLGWSSKFPTSQCLQKLKLETSGNPKQQTSYATSLELPSTIADQILFLCMWPSKKEWSSKSNSCKQPSKSHERSASLFLPIISSTLNLDKSNQPRKLHQNGEECNRLSDNNLST